VKCAFRHPPLGALAVNTAGRENQRGDISHNHQGRDLGIRARVSLQGYTNFAKKNYARAEFMPL
jgi:hypothetical protein